MILSSFLVILLVYGIYGALHSLLASAGAKALAQRILGARYRYYRLGYNIFSGLTILPVIYLAWRLPDARLYIIPWPWRLLTVVIQLFAALGLLASFRVTGSLEFLGMGQFLHLHQPPVPETLRVDGMYRFVRHPIYSFSLLILWLTPVMSGNLLALAVGITLYILIGSTLEERKLVQQFGEAYRAYQAQTGKFIPRLASRQ